MSTSIKVRVKANSEELSKDLVFPTEDSGLKGLLVAIEKAKVECNKVLTKIVESSGNGVENGNEDNDLPEDSDDDVDEVEPCEKKAKN